MNLKSYYFHRIIFSCLHKLNRDDASLQSLTRNEIPIEEKSEIKGKYKIQLKFAFRHGGLLPAQVSLQSSGRPTIWESSIRQS